jgi:hypothetical protein
VTHVLPPESIHLAPLAPTAGDLPRPVLSVATAGEAPATLERTSCANCQAALVGPFCAQCGAPRLDDRPLTVRRFAGDLWEEVTSLDSGTQRTLRALFFTPGRLTREYLDGRTRWYLSPLRLFLMTIALYLFAHSALGLKQKEIDKIRATTEETRRTREARRAAVAHAGPTVVTPRKPLTPKAAKRKRVLTAMVRDLGQTTTDVMTSAMSNQWLQLVNPLAIAVALTLIYRRKRRNYAEHVVHALHLMSFVAICTIGIDLVEILHGEAHHTFDLCFALFWVILARYFYLSAQRVYGDSPRRTAVDTALFAIGGQSAMFVLPLVVGLAMLGWFVVKALVQIFIL